MNLEILEIGDDQLPAIRELAIRIWPGVFNSMVPPAQVDYMLANHYNIEALKEARRKGEIFHLVKLDGQVIGYITLTDFGDKTGKLNKIYLDSNIRGLGLGRKLLEFARDWGIKHGLERLKLNVNKANQRAMKVYQAAGWTPYSQETIDIGGGFICDDYIYELKLN